MYLIKANTVDWPECMKCWTVGYTTTEARAKEIVDGLPKEQPKYDSDPDGEQDEIQYIIKFVQCLD